MNTHSKGTAERDNPWKLNNLNCSPFIVPNCLWSNSSHTRAYKGKQKEEREAYAKLVLHTVIKCGNKTAARGVGGGRGAGHSFRCHVAVCGSYGTLPFSLEGVQALRHIKGNSKLSVSPKAAPGLPTMSCFMRVCVWECVVCLPSDMSASALAICFTAFDSRYSFCIWFDNNAFQNGLPSPTALPPLPTPFTHTHKKLIWLSRQSHTVGQGGS